MKEQEDMRNAEKARLTTRMPKTTFEEMLNAIRDSLRNLASCDDKKNGEDEEDEADTQLGKLSDDDELG